MADETEVTMYEPVYQLKSGYREKVGTVDRGLFRPKASYGVWRRIGIHIFPTTEEAIATAAYQREKRLFSLEKQALKLKKLPSLAPIKQKEGV